MPTIVSMLPVEKGHAGLVQAQADKAKNFFGGAMKAAGVHVAAMRWRMNAQDADDTCLLYTSPSPRDLSTSRMPSSA